MTLEKLDHEFSICKTEDFSGIKPDGEFTFISKTDDEISVVCKTQDVPENTVARNDGWSCFRIAQALDFSLVGILSKITGILAQANTGVFAVSTYNTDYIFVKSENSEKASRLLSEAGYTVV